MVVPVVKVHDFQGSAYVERDLLLRFFPEGDWRRPPRWPGFGRYRSLAICFELLGQFDDALAAYREEAAPLRGDALIALIGPTALGEFLELSPASFGSTTSAWLSALLWVCAICAAYYLYGFLLDCVDPTYRVQQRERRQAYGSGTMLAAFRRSGFGARIDRVTPRQRG